MYFVWNIYLIWKLFLNPNSFYTQLSDISFGKEEWWYFFWQERSGIESIKPSRLCNIVSIVLLIMKCYSLKNRIPLYRHAYMYLGKNVLHVSIPNLQNWNLLQGDLWLNREECKLFCGAFYYLKPGLCAKEHSCHSSMWERQFIYG